MGVMPWSEFAQLRSALRMGSWMLRESVYEYGNAQFNAQDLTQPEQTSIGQRLVSTVLALAERAIGLTLQFNYAYCFNNAPGSASDLHTDVDPTSDRRVWSAIFTVEASEDAYRELDFFTRNADHVDKFFPTPNSLVLYPSMLLHAGKRRLEGSGE